MGQEIQRTLRAAESTIRATYGGDMMKSILGVLEEIRNAAIDDYYADRDHVITLCGSTRFYEHFKLAGLKLTLNDWLVYSIGIDTKSDADIKATGDFRIDHERLDKLHKRKIDKSSAIMVIDVDGYVGESTRSEIEYARDHFKTIYSYTKTTDFAQPTVFDLTVKLP